MGEMKEEGMDEQQQSEVWEKFLAVVTQRGLVQKFKDWVGQLGVVAAFNNLEMELYSAGEEESLATLQTIKEQLALELMEEKDAQESCGEGCGCAGHEEIEGGISSNEVNTPVEAEEVVTENKMKYGYRPIMPE
jgi:hypothetical protein